MNVSEPCPTCNTINACECQSTLTSFFKILKCTSDRVLSDKQASSARQPEVVTAGIDKLNAYFISPISTDTIRENCKQIGAPLKRVFLKDRKPYLSCGLDSKQIHLKLGFGETNITGIISNPNRFKTWQNYFNFISSVVPQQSVVEAQVTRIDLNLDFACSFASLTQMLDVKNKRSALTFIDTSGSRTGLIIGKGDEKIEIYDKAKLENLPHPLCRVELRLAKKKLPDRSIEKIPVAILSASYFEGLTGMNTSFTDVVITSEQALRLSTFKHSLVRDGFYSAKKSMNQMRNFDRDFAKLIRCEYWTIQPTQLFNSKIKEFIKPQEEKIWMQ